MRQYFFFAYLLISISACRYFKPLEAQLVSANDETRLAALGRLSHLSMEKQIRVSANLLNYLNDPESRVANRAADALLHIGKPAVEGLRQKTTDKDLYARINAISILGQIGPLAAAALPNLTGALKDPHPLIREEAIIALGQMGESAKTAIPSLLDAFATANPEEKRIIVDSLKRIGVQPPPFS